MHNILMALLIAGSAAAQVELSGFVDASAKYDMDPQAFGFSVDQVELDLQRDGDDGVLLRADLDFGDDGMGGWMVELEQAFLTVDLPLPLATQLSFGRFNAPFGFEALDAPDMYQYSHALVFDFGLMDNFTGLKADIALSPMLDLALILGNSWDANTETDMEKTFAGRLGASLGDLGIGLSWIADAEVNGDDSQLVWDIDASYTLESWLFGAEYNMGTYTDATDTDFSWSGMLLMAHYDFNDWMGLTLRYDMFNDEDNLRMGESMAVSRTAITIAPTFVLGENMGALIEYRMDTVDEEVWTDGDGNATDSASFVAFEITYGF